MNFLRSRLLISLYLAIGLVSVAAGQATPPTRSDQQTITRLQKQVADLGKELTKLKESATPEAQRLAMQRHWELMQEHMRAVGRTPGVMAGGRRHGQMVGPGMMGRGMGPGPGMRGWTLPPGVTPQTYREQMGGHMQAMRDQMAAISAEKDPEKRLALMRQHHDAMYRNMQTMRGMGWMWAPRGAGSLPDADSKGARLVSTYCSQCHAPPSPSLHTGKEWGQVTSRMRAHIRLALSGASDASVTEPTAAEMDAILDYMAEHGR